MQPQQPREQDKAGLEKYEDTPVVYTRSSGNSECVGVQQKQLDGGGVGGGARTSGFGPENFIVPLRPSVEKWMGLPRVREGMVTDARGATREEGGQEQQQ